MANFNLEDYETVEERLRRFWADDTHKDARIVTVNRTTSEDRAAKTWVVEARIYMDAGDQSLDLPKATGWAFEIDGVGLANKTSALENAETSSIGRALANMNYSGNKRASREEMAKVARADQAAASTKWVDQIAAIASKDEARDLWAKASKARAPKDVLSQIEAKAQSFDD